MNVTLTRFFAAFVLMASVASFAGCGGHSGGLATDSGTMTMEEFERLKAEEQKAIEEGMSGEMKKK